jgi:hypothetical protein
MLKVYFVGRVPKWKSSRRLRFESGKMKSLYKTKDRVTRTPLKTVGELRCPGRVNSSCITLVAHFVHYKGEQFSLIQSELSMGTMKTKIVDVFNVKGLFCRTSTQVKEF